MKFSNIKFYAVAHHEDNSRMGDKFFCTEAALSNWANKCYRKDERVTVYAYNFADNSLYCIYHA